MSELGDSENPVGLAWGRGIPEAVAETIIPARYNDLDVLRRIFEREGDDIAGDHHRAGPRQRPGDPAAAGLPRGDPGAHRGVRHPPHLRRGQDRLPVRPGRRGRVLRGHPRPGHLRQGDGQRLPGGRVRWHRGGHERPARPRQPRRDVRRQPGRRRGRRQDPDDPQGDRRPRADPRHGPYDPGRARGVLDAARAGLHASPGTRRCSGSSSPSRRADRVPRLGEHGPRAVRRDRDRDASPRRDARARLARAVVPVRGPRRRATTSTGSCRSSRTRSTPPSRRAPTRATADAAWRMSRRRSRG